MDKISKREFSKQRIT